MAIETSEPITTAAGTFRVRVEYDPYGSNPRNALSNSNAVGTMVCEERDFDRPQEGYLSSKIVGILKRYDAATAERIVTRYLRMAHDAIVVPVYSTGYENRLVTASDSTREFLPRDFVGVIYIERTGADAEWPGATDAEISGYLTEEVAQYDVWSCNEMTEYVIERQCPRCQEWREVDSCGTYYSVDEAMEVAKGRIPDDVDAHPFGTVEQRCPCESTLPSPLSDAARAVIAGLVAPTDSVNSAGIYANDPVWDEIRAAFPLSLFENRPPDVTYDAEAGW